MANNVVYYPLLKKGFQELPDESGLQQDVSQLQTEVEALQQSKITKITDAAQLSTIALNEIIQWQTDDATVDGNEFKNGFFYKLTSQGWIIPAGTEYFLSEEAINEFGYNITIGNYYVIENNIPLATSDFYKWCLVSLTSNYVTIWNDYGNTLWIPQVGDYVWDKTTNDLLTITNVSFIPTVITLSNGDVLTLNTWSEYPFDKLYKVVDTNGTTFNIVETTIYSLFVHYTANGTEFTVIDFIPVNGYFNNTTSEVTIGANVFTQTNAQPQQLSVDNNIVKYTLSDGVTELNLAQLPGDVNTLLEGHLLGWNSTTQQFETKTANGGKYDSFDGTTFANKTILSCCISVTGGGYNFLYVAARQTDDGKLILYGYNTSNYSRDSVTLTDVTTSANAWSGIGASLSWAYFVYI